MFSISALSKIKEKLHGGAGLGEADPDWAHIVVLCTPADFREVEQFAANVGYKVLLIPTSVIASPGSWGVADIRHPGSTIWHNG